MASKIIKEGKLCRYGSDGGILSFKKGWRECYGVLTEDSTLKLYKDQTVTSKPVELNFDASVLWLAFGKDAEKYDPPKVSSAEENSSVGTVLHSKNYIAVPKDKNRDSITWLAAYDKESLHSWIHAIALTVKNMSKPPILGAKRADNKTIMQQLKEDFDIDETNAEEWEIYWLYTVIGGSLQNNAVDEVHILEIQKSNLIEDGSEETKSEGSDLSSILDNWKINANLTPKLAPKPPPRLSLTPVLLHKDTNGIFLLTKDESYLDEDDVAFVPHKHSSVVDLASASYVKDMGKMSDSYLPDAMNKLDRDSLDTFPAPPSPIPIEVQTAINNSNNVQPIHLKSLRHDNVYNLTDEDQEVIFVPYPSDTQDVAFVSYPNETVAPPTTPAAQLYVSSTFPDQISPVSAKVSPISSKTNEDLYTLTDKQKYEEIEVTSLEKSNWGSGMDDGIPYNGPYDTSPKGNVVEYSSTTFKNKSNMDKDIVELTEYKLIEEIVGTPKISGKNYRTSIQIEIRNS